MHTLSINTRQMHTLSNNMTPHLEYTKKHDYTYNCYSVHTHSNAKSKGTETNFIQKEKKNLKKWLADTGYLQTKHSVSFYVPF